MKVNNPILSGFYPDPSVCSVGEDFYLVTSTFAYFPGVPIFHSRDLKNWEQIGNILDRESQLPLKECRHSAGIFAPTIRYCDGVYYMITTNISGGGNFIVTAEDPKGPWSEPYFLGYEAAGIDPSLLFDDDGKCYYVGTRSNTEGEKYYGDSEIWVRELDLSTMKLVGEDKRVWKSAFTDAAWPEAPHLYKINGYYYLLIAEGGTGPNHSVTVARSKSVWGPYESNPNNPILTHRHLGKDYPVVYVGHGDLIEAIDGNWYIVMLASRPYEGYTNMGRETFLAKVVWEDGWPVVNLGIGKLEDVVDVPLKENKIIPEPTCYHFDDKELPYAFLQLRNPGEGLYSLQDRKGCLRLYMRAETLKEQASPSYIALRQRHHKYHLETKIESHTLSDNEVFGLAVVQSNEYHVRFEVCKKRDKQFVRVVYCMKCEDEVIAETEITTDQILFMKIVQRGQKADFYCKTEEKWILVAEDVDMHHLSTEVANGFTGCTVGMYASANGGAGGNYVDYHWLSYAEIT